jgi:hypothetical protein
MRIAEFLNLLKILGGLLGEEKADREDSERMEREETNAKGEGST